MSDFTQKEIKRILNEHLDWITSGGTRGCKAIFTGADLSGANLTGAVLSGAVLFRADLSGANLHGADLYWANLFEADLRWANLKVATAKGCWIRKAWFSSPEDRVRLLMLGAVE